MTAIDYLKRHGLAARAEPPDRLLVSPADRITDPIRAWIREHKRELLTELGASQPAAMPATPHVWSATVDGKRVWIIDSDHTDYTEQLRRLRLRFGQRVGALQRATTDHHQNPTFNP